MAPPLFVAGIPGGIELVVIAIIAILVFGLPIALIAAYLALSRARRGEPVSETDVEEIKAQLAELQAAVDEVRSEDEE